MSREAIDLTGKEFGRLKVLERAENNKWGQIQWLCRCNCDGKEVIKTGSTLKSGHTKSCGCLNKEIVSKLKQKYNTYDLSGEYGIGWTEEGIEFYFDIEDYDLIKDYYWNKDQDGYIKTTKNKKYLWMHRLVTNCPDDKEVDHIYHVNHDNRKSELRIVTVSQNGMNRKINKNNTSGVKGVYWSKQRKEWYAQIRKDNIRIHLGYYKNKEDAIWVRKEAEIEYFGEYNLKA